METTEQMVKAHTYEPVEIQLVAMATPAGASYIYGATYRNSPCGCEVEGNGTLPHPLQVKHCKKHS